MGQTRSLEGVTTKTRCWQNLFSATESIKTQRATKNAGVETRTAYDLKWMTKNKKREKKSRKLYQFQWSLKVSNLFTRMSGSFRKTQIEVQSKYKMFQTLLAPGKVGLLELDTNKLDTKLSIAKKWSKWKMLAGQTAMASLMMSRHKNQMQKSFFVLNNVSNVSSQNFIEFSSSFLRIIVFSFIFFILKLCLEFLSFFILFFVFIHDFFYHFIRSTSNVLEYHQPFQAYFFWGKCFSVLSWLSLLSWWELHNLFDG